MEKKKSKLATIILIVVLSLTTLGFGGYFVYDKFIKEETPNIENNNGEDEKPNIENNNGGGNSSTNQSNTSTTNEEKINNLVKKHNLTKNDSNYADFIYYYGFDENTDRIGKKYDVKLTIEGGKLVFAEKVNITYDETIKDEDKNEAYYPDGKNLFKGTPVKLLDVRSLGAESQFNLYIIDSKGDLYTLDQEKDKNNTGMMGLIHKKPTELNYYKLSMGDKKFVDFYKYEYIQDPDGWAGLVTKYYVSTTDGKIYELANAIDSGKLGTELK